MTQLRVIDNFDDFRKLEQAWNELVSHTDVDHVYMKHQWFSEWIKAYEVKNSLTIVTIWRDGQLVAAAPLYRKPLKFKKVKARGIGFLSSGVSPRCNFIALDNQAMGELITAVLGLSKWDILITDNMEKNTFFTEYFIDFLKSAKNNYSYNMEPGFQSLYLPIEGSWDNYWKSLSRKWRTNFKRYSLERLETVRSFEVNHIRAESEGVEFFPEMFNISKKSWKASVENHLVPDSPLGRLYSNFTPIGLRQGWIYIPNLKINGSFAGYVYFLHHNGKYVGIRAEFDEDFKSCSPGNNLHLAIIKDLFKSGQTCEYDLGPDALYKRNFCDKIKKHVTVFVGNKNIKGRWIMFTKNYIMPVWRKISSKAETPA
ncbi:MAG: GNAT family N-acetyltransferase [candidate division Zixibacteria bacterium]